MASYTAKFRRLLALRLCGSVLIFALPAVTLNAGFFTWNGGGGNVNWGTLGNWTGGIPTSAATTDLIFAGTTNVGTALTPLNLNIANPFVLNSITFNSGGGAFYLGGNALRFDGATTSNITQSSSSAESIANAFAATTNSGTPITLTGNGTGLVTLSGIISAGSGQKDYSIVKNGTSTFSLTGTNTYGGGTTINTGTLVVNSASSMGASSGGCTLNAGTLEVATGYSSSRTFTLGNVASTFQIDPSQTFTMTSAIGGTGALNKTGSGTLTLSASNTYSGGTVIDAGTVVANSNTSLGNISGALTLNAGTLEISTGYSTARTTTLGDAASTIQVDSAQTLTVTSAIGGSGTLNKTGTGTMVLSGSNTYSGATSVTSGVLNLQNASALGTTANGTTISAGAALQLQGVIAVGAEALTLNGSGVASDGALRNISGNNSYAGNVILGSATTIKSDSGTLTLSGNFDNGGFAATFGGVGSITNSGVISGSGALAKIDAGTLTLSGTNTFNGGVTLNAGTLSISSDANLGASSNGITFAGGTLQSSSDILGSRAITMTGAGTFNGVLGKTIEESGAVSGNGNITVSGSGTLILSGSGSNGTGTTTLSSGILSLRGTVSLGTGNLTFASGVLELGNGNFTRSLGAGAGQVNMSSVSGGAGFAAYGADRTVNLGGSGATVTWNSGNFVASGQPFYLGTPTADHMVDFQNPINLNALTDIVNLTAGTGTGADAKLSGVISGTGASNLVISTVGAAPWNPGSLILSNGSNSYAGTTTINAGTLLLGANASGTAGNTVLGSGASDILVGNTSGAVNAGLLTNGAYTVSRNIRAQSGNTGTISIGGNSANSSIFSGNVFLGTNSGIGKGVTLTAASGGTATFSGIIQDPTAVSGFGAVIKDGAGTVVLSGVNTYSGGTQINGGTLSVSQASNLGAAAGGLTINSGTLELTNTFSTSRILTLGSSSSTFQVDPSQTFTVTSAIGGSGSGTLNKTGTGTMVLGGANTFTNGTNVSAGTLQISASERLANAGALTVSGGTFDLQTFTETLAGITLTSGSITGTGTGTLIGSSYGLQSGSVSAILGGSGSLTKSTAGTVTLTGANTYSGGTSINGGVLVVGSSGALGSSGNISFSGGGTLQYTSSNTTDYSARFSNLMSQTFCIDTNAQNVTLGTAFTSTGGTMTKMGAGALTLSGANSYTGSTTVSGGTLQVNVNNALGTNAAGTTVANGAALKLNGVNYSTTEGLTLNGTGVSNNGALYNTGTSTFAGAINIATNATINAGGGILNLTGGVAKNGTVLTLAGGGTININGNGITGSMANSDLVVDGTTVDLNTANSYNGPTTIQNSGTIKLGASNVLPSSPQTDMTVNTSSIFDLASFSDGVASLAGDSTATIKNSTASSTSTLTVNPGTGVSTTFAGVIAGTNGGTQGNVALLKTGAGTLTLSGTNTFSSTTTISGGTLIAAGASGSALGSTSAITVNSGGTLLLGASDQINNSATITLHGGTLTRGSGNYNEGGIGSVGMGALTLNATGSHIDFGTGTVGILTFASFSPGGNTLTIDNWTGTVNTQGITGSTDRLIFDSDQSSNLNSFSFAGFGGPVTEFALGSGYFEVVPVPEPATWVSAALSLAGLVFFSGRRRLARIFRRR